MRTLISILAVIASLSACAPHTQLPAQQTFSVCIVGGKYFANEALVILKGETEANLYDFDTGFNGQYKFRPHVGTDDGLTEMHHAFMAVSRFDPHKVNWRGDICQDVVGRLID